MDINPETLNIIDLPNEILIKIFKTLDIKNIRKIAKVCKLFYQIGKFFKNNENYVCLCDSQSKLIKDFNFISKMFSRGNVYIRVTIPDSDNSKTLNFQVINYIDKTANDKRYLCQIITIEGYIFCLYLESGEIRFHNNILCSMSILTSALSKHTRRGIELSSRYNYNHYY